MKTLKQQKYNQQRCKYCMGTGRDIFDKSKPCPNCSKEEVILSKEEVRELRDEKIRYNTMEG